MTISLQISIPIVNAFWRGPVKNWPKIRFSGENGVEM